MKKLVELRRVPLKIQAAAPITGNGGKKVEPARPAPGPSAAGMRRIENTGLREATGPTQQIRLSLQRELDMARKIRADAERYQAEMATRARSEAQQVILRTRLSSQRQVEELVHKASEEIQKVLADIRMIRITAQEELAAQRKFTDAARLLSMSLSIQGDGQKADSKKKKHPAGARQ
ncbi:MAG: hypothetical protein A2Z29_00505 [Chloroflexi bacterium RBG_16_56_11]|nr:MAG: hypothetical protein A2Z29_00505 [Chloroflexi bacterium RBG_16_56_11]